MNKQWHITVDVIDGERYLSADEAEQHLCDVLMDIEAAERHWDALRSIFSGLQLAAAIYHPQISAKLWDSWPDWARRAAIKPVEDREQMVRTTVHAIMPNYVEEKT